MTGQARAAASRRGRGEGFTTIRRAPTAIVSRPATARPCSRLSARSAMAFAWRHSRARLSARRWSLASTLSWADNADDSNRRKSGVRRLHIHQHPAAGEDRQWARPVENDEGQLSPQAPLYVRDPGTDLLDHPRSEHPQ